MRDLPDDYFAEDDAGEDNTQTIRRWMEETETMTLFMLEDVDAGEKLRIETTDSDDLALTITDESGAGTIHLTLGDLALLRDWLTDTLTRNQADE